MTGGAAVGSCLDAGLQPEPGQAVKNRHSCVAALVPHSLGIARTQPGQGRAGEAPLLRPHSANEYIWRLMPTPSWGETSESDPASRARSETVA